jgi:hypothetical protein
VNRRLRKIVALLTLLLAIASIQQLAYAEQVKLGLPSKSRGYLPLFVALKWLAQTMYLTEKSRSTC